MAEDEQTVERIEDGDIASAERKRNETILNHIRNQGTERELKKTAIGYSGGISTILRISSIEWLN